MYLIVLHSANESGALTKVSDFTLLLIINPYQ